MFPDITCDECACIRLRKCLIYCVDLKIGCIISAAVEILVGLGYLVFGAMNYLDKGTGDWEAAFRSLVVVGCVLTVLGILAVVSVFMSGNQEFWLCLAYVLHIIVGCALGCIGLMVYPFKRIYYSVIFIFVEIALAGWTALVLNSYRLDVIKWQPEGEEGAKRS